MTFATSAPVSAEQFHAPGPASFDLPAVFHVGSVAVTKPMLQLVLGAVVVFGFFFVAARKRALVPGRLQYAGEGAYGFVRNSVARDIIGSHDFQKFVPYLFATVLLPPDQQLLREHPVHPVPVVQPGQHGLRDWPACRG